MYAYLSTNNAQQLLNTQQILSKYSTPKKLKNAIIKWKKIVNTHQLNDPHVT
jgi:hypothetical protein